nr:hypothetical protein [uncultured Enterobacter sp.]
MDILSAMLKLQSRSVGVLVPSAVVTEKHTDTLVVTDQPVESGASLSDHAWMKPGEVVMVCLFASGGSLLDFKDTRDVGISYQMSPQETYQQLLALQKSRQPFDVITGKRTYSNMLMTSLVVDTDSKSEYALKCTLTLREVLFSDTTLKTAGKKSDMALGANTSPVQDAGTKALKPADSSRLNP